ncbi:putative cupredoxin [Rosa chinensis]|uniref:Putative cupredoxin n=1 Tax=Rosa chinensis TaxID=74649 RepID=A0A2P6RIU7_ROSCH|nr:putative cupredoxin [Rosa chinensis]
MKTMNMIVVVLAMAVVLLHGAEAVLYTVGDDLGWAIPPGGAATYAAWAAEHSFVFDFAVGEQDLALVTKDDYDSCNTVDPLLLFQEAVTLQFIASDTFYFTSTLAGHCTKGQKIAIYIGAALPPSPSPTPCPSSSSADDALTVTAKFVSHKIMAKGN